MQPFDPESEEKPVDEHGEPALPASDEDGPVSLGGRFADFEPGVANAAPDGGAAIVENAPAVFPERTPDHWICLRGPCRYYMSFKSSGGFGNPVGTFEKGKEPKQHYNYCLRLPPHLDMEDDVVEDCSLWDPIDPDDAEVLARGRRREKYLALHPVAAPAPEQSADEDDAIDEAIRDWVPPGDDGMEVASPIAMTSQHVPASDLSAPPNPYVFPDAGTSGPHDAAVTALARETCTKHPPSDASVEDHAMAVRCAHCGYVGYYSSDLDVTMRALEHGVVIAVPSAPPKMPAQPATPDTKETTDVGTQESDPRLQGAGRPGGEG